MEVKMHCADSFQQEMMWMVKEPVMRCELARSDCSIYYIIRKVLRCTSQCTNYYAYLIIDCILHAW